MLVHILAAPRTIVLEDDGFCLLLHTPELNGGVRATLERVRTLPHELLQDGRDVLGCIGLLRADGRTFVAMVTKSSYEGPDELSHWRTLRAERAYRVREVEIYCLNDGPLGPEPEPRKGAALYGIDRFLSDGSFFYSATPSFDITLRLSERIALQKQTKQKFSPVARAEALDGIDAAKPSSRSDIHSDAQLVYNLHMISPLLTLRNSFTAEQRQAWDDRAFALPLCQGFFSTTQVEHDGQEMLVTVISRRRWARAGTRYNKRGIDGGGNVGNFAETETIVRSRKECFSFVQVRGSVPLIWTERQPTGPPAITPPAVTIHEPLMDSLRPFRLHFYSLLDRYGPVHILNLMSTVPHGHLAPEEKLGAAYAGLDQLASNFEPEFMTKTFYREFDIVKTEKLHGGINIIPERLSESVQADVEKIGATVVKIGKFGHFGDVQQKQEGVFRVNCRDCCDRTNLGQWIIAHSAVGMYCKAGSFEGSQLERALSKLWSKNGDALAMIYTGGGAMNSEFVRCGRAAHHDLVDNMKVWAMRVEQARLRDPEKQRETSLIVSSPRVFLVAVDKDGALLPM